ncbi:MAG: hypothetical protein ACK5TR_00205 [Alphaproteobacteria bacterium]|jgi:hypothetical protein|nr:hypothetical protein [Alphaproteobacteria bacterium]
MVLCHTATFLPIPHAFPERCLPPTAPYLWMADLHRDHPLTQTLFKTLFGKAFDNEGDKDMSLNALISALPLKGVLFRTNTQTENEAFEKALIQVLETQKSASPHLIFNVYLSPWSQLEAYEVGLRQKPHTFVLTDKTLKSLSYRPYLHLWLATNPLHHVILMVSAAKNHTLCLKAADLPSSLKHLIITNPARNVRIIEKDFLSESGTFQTLFFRGVSDVQLIEDDFASFCPSLTRVNLDALYNVRQIKDRFLIRSALSNFRAWPFKQTHTLGTHFLSHNKFLLSCDTKGLEEVEILPDHFLSYCPRLIDLRTEGLCGIKEMRNHCFYNATSLTRFNCRPFTKTICIGEGFLACAFSFPFVDTRGFDYVEIIGAGLMRSPLSLTRINTRGFGNITTIGPEFMALAAKLERFDLTSFRCLQTVGKDFLSTTLVLSKAEQ